MQTKFVNVSSQEMAPKKLPTKRARKDAAGEGSSVAPHISIYLYIYIYFFDIFIYIYI